MRRFYLLILASLLFVSWSAGQPTVQYQPTDVSVTTGANDLWSFDDNQTGTLPPQVTVFSGIWGVQAETSAPSAPNALCQTGNATYPAMILSNTLYGDVSVTVQFKPISGTQDQAAGVIVRAQDSNNFYIIRANALENNLNIYEYSDSARSLLKDGKTTIKSGEWQTLHVEVIGNSIRAFLNDQWVVEVTDNTFAVGQVGLWTKADSYTCFDNVQVTAK